MVISITLPPAILTEECEKRGIGVVEKARGVFATGGLGSRDTGERRSNGVEALGRDERRAKRKEVGGLICAGFSGRSLKRRGSELRGGLAVL